MKKLLCVLSFLALMATALVITGCVINVPFGDKNDYYPDNTFRTSTPEAQGMDSTYLSGMLERVTNRKFHSILIIRNGYMVLDANFYPYKSTAMHAVYSCTKSVTSALVGIAIQEGYIEGVDSKVLTFFPGRELKNASAYKDNMTLEHLLTMTTGFEWSETGTYDARNSWVQMASNKDPLGFILDKAVLSEPGKQFYYNTGATHLLSGVMQQAIGEQLAVYAEEKLFKPMGIQEKYWSKDAQGMSMAGSGLSMTPIDMAKFGYLYLREGKWKGEQLVPQDWIADSVRKHVDTFSGLAGHYGYGYQWWMNDFGGYSARGYNGQYIFVVPEHDLVVVVTGELGNLDFFLPERLMREHIIPSIKSEKPLPKNKQEYDTLQEKLKLLSSQPD